MQPYRELITRYSFFLQTCLFTCIWILDWISSIFITLSWCLINKCLCSCVIIQHVYVHVCAFLHIFVYKYRASLLLCLQCMIKRCTLECTGEHGPEYVKILFYFLIMLKQAFYLILLTFFSNIQNLDKRDHTCTKYHM